MSNFKMSKEAIMQLILDQGDRLSDSDKVDIAQALLRSSEGSKYFLCPTDVASNLKVDIGTILYLSQPQNRIATIYLLTGEEVIYKTEVDLLSYIETNFDNFKCVDQINGILVNMDMVKWYDSDMNRVYFSEEHFIQVTGAAIRNIISKHKGKECDLFLMKKGKEKGMYAPLGAKLWRKLT